MSLKGTAGRFVRRSTRFPGFRLRESSRFLNVRMDTTNRCNLRCSMCPMRLSDSDPGRVWHDMDEGLFGKIAREVFPLAGTVAISCGAEPLCNPAFEDRLEVLYRSDVPVREMVTNGLLLTPDRSERILACPPTSLFVSIDGACAETHSSIRGGCSLKAVLENLAALVRLRGRRRFPLVSFSTTLQRGNLGELEDIVRLAGSAGAAAVGVVPLVPYEGLDTSAGALDMSAPEVSAAVDAAALRARELGIGFSVSARQERDPSEPCPYCMSWIYIDPDGLVDPCPYWDTSAPLGDLRKASFREIWESRSYEALRSVPDSPSCASCPEVRGTGRAEIRKTGAQTTVKGSCSAP